MDIQITNFLNLIYTAIWGECKELSYPDWDKLYYYGNHQMIFPLLFEGCNKYQEFESVPESMREKYFVESVDMIMWQTQRTEAFLTVYDKLIEEGLMPLVLKGLVCRSTYQKLADHRPSGDEDIYVKKDEFISCKDILLKNGYIMENIQVTEGVLDETQEISFYNHTNNLHIEVHLSMMGYENKSRRRMNSFFTNAFDTAITLEINGHYIYTLSHTNHYLYLFLHFYKHFTLSGVGIRQLIDVFMYEKKYRAYIDWTYFHQCIEEVSAQKLYADSVAIGRLYLGFQIETELFGYNSQELIEDIMGTGALGNSTQEQLLSSRITLANTDKQSGLRRMFFPKISVLKYGYPELYERPYLLPFVWVKRGFRFLRRKKQKNRLIADSIRIGKQRVLLLKKYGIIP